MPVKKGNVTLAICFGFFLLCALSMGNRMYLLIAIIIALGCIGNAVQSNSISQAMNTAFGAPLAVSGVITAVISGLVFFGGLGRLASVAEKLVPIMAGIYLIGGSYVILEHLSEVGPAFALIFEAAFNPQAVAGGALGLTVAKAMQFGVARGLFSNEAGMGSTPHAHAVAKVEHPAIQGLVAMFGVFATVVVSFPLMYRTARGAFESFDPDLAHAAQTLGRSNTWIFWRVRMPCCRQGILAGTVLAFARALGEYGATSMIAGYTPGRTATISTTVYQLWRTDNDALAFRWVLVNIAISAAVLLAVNLLERRDRARRKEAAAC